MLITDQNCAASATIEAPVRPIGRHLQLENPCSRFTSKVTIKFNGKPYVNGLNYIYEIKPGVKLLLTCEPPPLLKKKCANSN